jgi:hypothetical protein
LSTEIISAFHEGKMKINVASRISTETSLINSLIVGIRRGETKIPQFQRRFVWKDQQALDLLDSIVKNYPVGSILLWRTKDKLHAERNIGEFKLPATDDMTPTDYVLDGQQRLTVIYSCLGAPEEEKGFAVAYDLEKEVFLKQPDELKITQFPVRRIFNTTKLLNFRTALQTLPDPIPFQQRLDQIIQAFSDYRIPVVTLKDLTVDEVCPIFERINSSGTKLSTFDLMVAATWSKEFDLNDEVDEICDALEPKGFGDIDRTTVLKCLSAIQLGTIKEESLKSLREMSKVEMAGLIEKSKQALLKTVDLFSTEFLIHSWDFLSYEALVVIVSHIYSKTDRLNSDQVKRLRQWFWRSSFGERYKVGGENFVSKDLASVMDFVVSANGTPDEFGRPPTKKEWFNIPYRSNVSRTRAFILALASKKPKNLTNGSIIDPAEALSSFNKKQFHHIYPRAFLKRNGSEIDSNLIINICMLSAAANNEISDSNPNIYFPRCLANLGNSADSVFTSNLLPLASEIDYAKVNYPQFLEKRVEKVILHVNHLCDGNT